MAGQSNPFTPITFSALLPLKVYIFTVNMPPSLNQLSAASDKARGGGIFAVKMLTFSGKSAEKVMGVNEFDCPAIFWEQERSTFWG